MTVEVLKLYCSFDFQTERQMVQICEGQKTKNDMLTENIELYKEMYMRIKREMNLVVRVRLRSTVFPNPIYSH